MTRTARIVAAAAAVLAAGALLAVGCATGKLDSSQDASIASDANGTCDACGDGEVCNNGKCSSQCSGSEIACGAVCVDTKTDSKNCGGCGKACSTGYACSNGSCTCASPTLGCAGADAALVCINPHTDIDNCGACGNACTDGGANALPGCVDGGCGVGSCVTPYGDCNKIASDGCESDTQGDNKNCGSCGIVCDAGSPQCHEGGCTSDPCGNNVIDTSERCDGTTGVPAGGQVACYAPSTKNQCKFDFSKVPQLYCNGSCSWGGAQGCDQADADIYCKLTMGSSTSTASSFTLGTAEAVGGFSCATYGTNLGPMPEYGVGVDVWYQGTSILANHNAGQIISGATCTP